MEYKILTQDSFHELYNNLEKKKKHKNIKEIKYFRVDDLWQNYASDMIFFIALNEETVTGIALVGPIHGRLGIRYVSVHPLYQNLKIATSLLEKIFLYTHEKQTCLCTGSFTEEGSLYIKKVCEKLSQQYPDVDFQTGW